MSSYEYSEYRDERLRRAAEQKRREEELQEREDRERRERFLDLLARRPSPAPKAAVRRDDQCVAAANRDRACERGRWENGARKALR